MSFISCFSLDAVASFAMGRYGHPTGWASHLSPLIGTLPQGHVESKVIVTNRQIRSSQW